MAAWNAGHLRSNDLTEAVTAFFEKKAARVHRHLRSGLPGTVAGQSPWPPAPAAGPQRAIQPFRLNQRREPKLPSAPDLRCCLRSRSWASATASGAIAETISSASSRKSAASAAGTPVGSGSRGWARRGYLGPAGVGETSLVHRDARATPGRIGSHVEHAESRDLAARIGPALIVAAVLPHRHGSVRYNPKRVQDPGRAARRAQPTEPSICSSISRLHSTAYSIGRVRVMGSMKPFTIMPIAWVSLRPRLIR